MLMMPTISYAGVPSAGGSPTPAPTVVGTGTFGNAAGGTLTFAASFACAAGDEIFVGCETQGNTMPAPSGGYTQVGTQIDNGATVSVSAFQLTAAGGETTITINDSGDHQHCVAIVVRGCTRPGGNAVQQVGSGVTGSSDPTTVPGVTTTSDNNLIVGFQAQHESGGLATGWTNANLTGITNHGGIASGAGFNGGVSAFSGVMATAGATGNTTFNPASGMVEAAFQFSVR